MSSISLIFKQFSRSILLLACFTVWGVSAKAQGNAAKGEATYKSAGCTGCHMIDTRMVGPALGPIVSSETDDKWLASWVHNSLALVAAKDPKALKIYNEFSKAVMPGFASLSDGDVFDILAYVRADWKKLKDAKKAVPAAAPVAESGPSGLVVSAKAQGDVAQGDAAKGNAAQGDAAKGEATFKSAGCTGCHKIDTRMTGPALGPIISAETDDKWLASWVHNSSALVAAKDPKALKIYDEFSQAVMPGFASLSDGDVFDILAYVRSDWKKLEDAKKATPAAAPVAESGPSGLVVYGLIGVIILALIIILVLNKVIATLERLLTGKRLLPAEEEVTEEAIAVDKYATVKRVLKNKKLVFFILLCGTIAMGSWTWVTLWNTNVHTGYQPVQPIKFPHDLHAGVMQIQCQYCHTGAYKSKNASIPSLNVCMNCHKSIDRRMGATVPSPEIHKIYDALGYDPQTQKYDSLKTHPIQWIRIHYLPDFVYFNHSQHVKVGGIKCQQCHGPVETMKEVYQYSPLTMKWCIQCHKRTDINMKGNAYYANMEQVHDLIKRGIKVTPAQLGGIECGKCHY